MEAVVELDGVSYRYPGSREWALRDVSLSMGKGLTLVTGPTGSGKSTLLRVISGSAQTVHGGELRGRVEVKGRPVLVPQEFESFILMPTVAEDLEHAAHVGGASLFEARLVARRVAEDLGIEHLMHRSVVELSLGERQRVAVAAALAMGADVLLLDEPLAHQDFEGSSLIVDALKRFEAVVVAEHRVSRIASMASKVVVMRAGRVDAEGPPEDLAVVIARLMDPLAAGLEGLEACMRACRS